MVAVRGKLVSSGGVGAICASVGLYWLLALGTTAFLGAAGRKQDAGDKQEGRDRVVPYRVVFEATGGMPRSNASPNHIAFFIIDLPPGLTRCS